MLTPDEHLVNADWTKRNWDGPETGPQLRALLAMSGLTVEQFKELPIYRANGAELDRILAE